MMPGVAAQPLRRVSGSGGISNGWSLDFINEVYTKNGSPVTLADIIDKPERVGVNGLEILGNDPDGSVLMTGELLADVITAGWTTIIGFEKVAPAGLSELLFVGDVDLSDTIYIDVYTALYAADTGFVSRSINNSDAEYRSGVHKVAFTRTNALVGLSIDGSDAIADTTPNTTLNPMVVAGFGGLPSPGGSYDACYIRTFELIPPVGAGALPALSA